MKATASVFIRALVFEMRIGIYDHERERSQRVQVDLEVRADIDRPAASSAIEDALNYEALCTLVTSLAGSRHFPLVETFVGELAARLSKDFGIADLDLSVAKLDVIPATCGVGVRLRTGCFDPSTGRC